MRGSSCWSDSDCNKQPAFILVIVHGCFEPEEQQTKRELHKSPKPDFLRIFLPARRPRPRKEQPYTAWTGQGKGDPIPSASGT